MDLLQIKQWISQGLVDSLEGAWLDALEKQDQPKLMIQTIKELSSADKGEMAATLAGLWFEDMSANFSDQEKLDIARQILPSLPPGDELRTIATEFYRAVHGEKEHFEDFLRASGLTDSQTLRRAIQTMNVCMSAEIGAYLLNRFEDQVVRIDQFNLATDQFELTTSNGRRIEMDPKLLADEFIPADADDFRVLCAFEPDRVADLAESDPAAILIGACLAKNGSIEMPQLKDLLVPHYIDSDKWSRWWSRARSTAKRSETLSLEGRSPTVISYHPQGRSLEEELAEPAAKAKMPLEIHAIASHYARELASRKAQADPDFAGPLTNKLAELATTFMPRRQEDALAASLAIEHIAALGLARPNQEYPSAKEIIAQLDKPAETIANIGEPALWSIGYDLLSARPDAGEIFTELLTLLPVSELNTIAGHLSNEAIQQVTGEVLASPGKNLQICLWLWAGPARPVAAASSKLDILSRLLGLMEQLGRDWDADREVKKQTYQLIRSGLTAGGCTAFKQAADEMDEAVAATIRRRIELSDGLSTATREDLLDVLREKHPVLFAKVRVAPWLDEQSVWTTSEAFKNRQEQLTELMEITIPANSRAIGIAADHGDLSENSEWQYAIEERGRLQGQASQWQNDLGLARVLTPDDIPSDSVGIGSIVQLKNQADGEHIELTFLGPWDVDIENRVYSYKTPLAQTLMGKITGDVVTLKLDGNETQYEVVSMHSALDN